jgi:hypothetical protein
MLHLIIKELQGCDSFFYGWSALLECLFYST